MASLARSSLRQSARIVPRLSAARAFTSSAAWRALGAQYLAEEPAGPKVVGSIPGPKNKKATAELHEVFDVRSINMLADYEKSMGN